MNYFMCDIIGTFDGCDNNREESIKSFISNLNKMMELESIDELIFCFFSIADMEEVSPYIKEFQKYLVDSSIKMGPQFSYDSVLVDGKLRCTSHGKFTQLRDLLKSKKVNNLYIADDALSVQQLFEDNLEPTLKNEYKNANGTLEGYQELNKMVQFVPGISFLPDDKKIGSSVTSLLGLNECLNNYINKLSMKKNI